MDVHNFAVNLFCQSGTGLHSIMFVISKGIPVFFCLYSNATCSNWFVQGTASNSY
jgi:hypothetical protein